MIFQSISNAGRGQEFDSFGDMQRHIMTEHMQKGDIP
jgi:hypothetical protein